jgi:hypothetical protein
VDARQTDDEDFSVCVRARQMTKLLEELHNTVLFYSERHLNMQVHWV